MEPLEVAREIFWAAVRAVDGYLAVRERVWIEGESLIVQGEGIPLGRRNFVLGFGKASAWMARALEELLGERISGGLVITKDGHGTDLRSLELLEASHPIPDRRGLEGARKAVELCRGLGEDDLLICLISGGGSALMPLPLEGVGLEDKQRATELLLRSGARIEELNAVRKHLSQVKGGRLALLAYPARVLSLIISDVVGDRLEVIASGPTVPDPTTYGDALRVIEGYGLRDLMPRSVMEVLERGARREIPETPKPGHEAFGRVKNVILANNLTALLAGAERARELGFRPLILSSSVQGEAREVAKVHAAILRECLSSGHPLPPPACILSGGETTVTVRGDGLGGRNTEFALAFALEVEGLEGAFCLSAGSDGTDGPTDAAGAWADGLTIPRARELGLDPEDYLRRNDSYRFFEALGGLFLTGPTRTNVMDLRVLLALGR